nr:hypothetical protein OG409_02670 [Streptomyces sp. NBC_00974]
MKRSRKRLRTPQMLGVGVMALLLGLVVSPTAQAAPAAAAAEQCTGSWDGKTYWAKSPSKRDGGGYARTYWNSSTKQNCVKFWSSPYDGLASHITVVISDESGDYSIDPPKEHPANFHYFAGPLYTWFDSTGQCINVSGSLVRSGVTYRLDTGPIRCG